MRKIVLAAVAALIAAGAHAATVTTNTVVPSYDGKLKAPTSTSANFRLNFQGSELTNPTPNSRTPWEGLANAATGFYNSVSSVPTGLGFAEYVFAGPQNDFALMWGSPDSYNELVFFSGANEVFSIKGNDTKLTSTQGFVAGAKFVNVFISDITFDRVRFETTTEAFEYANVAPVPLPAAGWMLIAGLGGLGWLSRRRKA